MHTILIELWPLFSLVVHCSSHVVVGDYFFVSGLILILLSNRLLPIAGAGARPPNSDG